MNESFSFAKRCLRLWNFTISHGMAMFMSPRDDEHDTRLMVLFPAVSYFSCPTDFTCSGVNVEPLVDGSFRYRFLDAEGDYFLIALNMTHEVDGLEHSAPTLFDRAFSAAA